MRDYTGKTVFVGIDVHKKTYSITCLCEKIVVKRDTIKLDNQVFYSQSIANQVVDQLIFTL